MESRSGTRRRGRSRIVRWIIVAFVVCALAEPVIMYEVLARQKQVRSVAAQSANAAFARSTAGE